MKQRTFQVGFIISLIGAICFSFKAILVKMTYSETSIDSVSLLALRMIFSLPFFIVSAIIISHKKNNIKFTLTEWIKVGFAGCLGYYLSSLLDFIGLQYVSAGIERLILFIYPSLVLLFTSLLYKAKLNKLQWISVLLCYVGLLLAFSTEILINQNGSPNFYFGALAIFGCAFTYAAYIIYSGKLIPVIGAAKFNSYAMCFASIGVIIHFGITSNKSLLNLQPKVYLYSFLMAIVTTVIPSYLLTEAIKRIGSNNVAIISSVGPLSTIILAYLFLNEPITVFQVIGTIVVLAGVLLISVKKTVVP